MAWEWLWLQAWKRRRRLVMLLLVVDLDAVEMVVLEVALEELLDEETARRGNPVQLGQRGSEGEWRRRRWRHGKRNVRMMEEKW